ncbi:MAG: nucleotide exchange factor GrpE [Myxococcaceae bacterium]|jgi:molecular chaperone GrpE|nr:nucleotide exchange factor GrpE [Myxococcaceae bacterium]MCA3011872.1 nucleotide exchange factor GrpE [Myxococcaceae bacterium]
MVSVSQPDDTGKFSTSIADDVINEALKSVDKARAAVRGEPVETAPAPPPGAPPATAAPSASPTSELESLKTQLELSMAKGRELLGKVKDEHEKMLRAVADLENYKKRAAKEKEEVQKFGIEKLLKDFLPVVDNFDRALEHANASGDLESLKKGVEMVRKLFEDTLGKHGVRSFTSKGEVFDPNKHEAMSATETNEVPPNHVVNEVLRGFTLNERLVRPALVVISRSKPDAPAPTAPAEAPKPE